MSKKKSTILLSIISIIMILLLALTFVRFPVGENKTYNGALGALELDYDMNGGYAYTLEPEFSEDVQDISSVLEIIQNRLTLLGYENAVVKAVKNNEAGVKDYRIRIEVDVDTDKYGKDEVDKVTADIETVATYGELEFSMGASSDSLTEVFTDIKNPVKSVKYEGASIYNGEALYPVVITFTKDAYDEIMQNIDDGNSYISVKIGETELPIFGNESISKDYFAGRSITVYPTTEDYANRIVLQIQSGGLPYEYKISNPVKVSSIFGENAVLVSMIAVLGLLSCIIIAMFVMFRGFGFVSAYSLILFFLTLVWLVVAIPGIKLSIGSIVGIILAIVLASDGIIITIKRIREEFSRGKTVKAAVKTGFARALLPIISSCVVVAITSLCAFIFTTGQIKSLAIMLGIGSAVALICGLLFVRMFTTILLPLAKNKEAFLNLKREEA